MESSRHLPLMEHLLQDLALEAPVPAGACSAAASAMMGAALLCKVCRVTIGKKGYEASWPHMEALLCRCTALIEELHSDFGDDMLAYNRLVAAMKLPRLTKAEQTARHKALQSAWLAAVNSPLAITEHYFTLLSETKEVFAYGNRNAASDTFVAALQAHSSVMGAATTVEFNLPWLEDHDRAASVAAQVKKLRENSHKIIAELQEKLTAEK